MTTTTFMESLARGSMRTLELMPIAEAVAIVEAIPSETKPKILSALCAVIHTSEGRDRDTARAFLRLFA